MEWSAIALESLVSAFAVRRGEASPHEHSSPPQGAKLLDLALCRRLAAERRDLEPYLAMIRPSPSRMAMSRRGLGAGEGGKIVPFRH